MKRKALLVEFLRQQLLTLIFTLYFWIISMHKLLQLGETCAKFAAQKSY